MPCNPHGCEAVALSELFWQHLINDAKASAT
jgi:hypothetical protein